MSVRILYLPVVEHLFLSEEIDNSLHANKD